MEALLSCRRWFLLVQKSTTLEITSWSAASKLPWWGWRRSRQTLMMKIEETRRQGVWTGRTEHQVDRLLDSWILHSSGLTAYVAARALPKTLNWDSTGSTRGVSLLAFQNQCIGTIVQIHFICRNSYCASPMLRSRPVGRIAAGNQTQMKALPLDAFPLSFSIRSCVVRAF